MTSQPLEHPNADAYVGEQIHQLMWRRRMSQGELGALISVDQSTVSKKLRGVRTWTLDELLIVARHLEVSVAELLPGEDYTPAAVGRGRGVVSPTARYVTNSTGGAEVIALEPFLRRRALTGSAAEGLPGLAAVLTFRTARAQAQVAS